MADLGVQDTPPGSARLALAARLEAVPEDLGPLAAVWAARGAPHLHREPELPALAAALWPRADADAAARLGWQRSRVAAGGIAPLVALREVADAVRAAVAAPMTKGLVSAAVTRLVSPGLSGYCRGCGCVHVHEQLLRLAGLPGGIGLTGSAPLLLAPLPGWPGCRSGPPAPTPSSPPTCGCTGRPGRPRRPASSAPPAASSPRPGRTGWSR